MVGGRGKIWIVLLAEVLIHENEILHLKYSVHKNTGEKNKDYEYKKHMIYALIDKLKKKKNIPPFGFEN